MSTNDGLVIPVSTPGADKAAEDLGRVAAATAQVGHGATEMGASVARGGTASTQALAAIGASAARSESHLADLKVTGNAALQELGQKGAEFARSIGGAGGAVAELGVKILATAGPYGAMAAAGVGAIGMIVAALNEETDRLDRVRENSEILKDTNTRLGGSYNTITTGILAAKTAEEARTIAGRELLTVLQQRLALEGRGYDSATSAQQVRDTNTLAEAIAHQEGITTSAALALVQATIATGNATQQQQLFGVSITHSTDPMVEQRNQLNLIAQASDRAAAASVVERTEINRVAQARLAAARAAQGNATSDAAFEQATRDITVAEQAATLAQTRLNAAVGSAAALHTAAAASAASQTTAVSSLTEAEKQAANVRQAMAARAAAQSAAAAGPSAQEQRSAVEALRVAREANENAGRTIPLTESQAQAMRSLEFATREVALAERALRTGSHTTAERTALTTALNAQTQAQTAYRDSVEATARATADLLTKERDRLALQDAALQNKSALEAEREKDRTAAEDAANAQRRATSQAALMQNQSAQQASIAKLQSDRMDALKSSAEGLAGGFVSAGIAAAIAGEAIGPAMQKALSASLSSLAQQAAVKSLFELAEGFAALGSNPIAAPTHFTSAAIFAGVAVAAGAGAAATAPAPAAPASGGGAPAPAAGGMGTMNTGTSGGGSNNTVINYYAPTFGGREGGIGEVGQQIDRYRRDNTALRRSR